MIFSKKIVQFLAVAQSGSLLKASTAIHTTPSAISQGIRNLECKMGRKLVQKTKSGMSLTDAGKNFYAQIKPCFDEACEVLNSLKVDKNSEQEIFLTMDGFYYPQIQNNLHEILLQNKNINLNITCQVIYDIQSEILHGESDIIISPLNIKIEDSKIHKISLPTERVGIIMSKIILDKYRGDIKKILEIEKLILTKNAIESSTFLSLIKKLKLNKKTKKSMTMNEEDTLHLLNKGIGFTLSTECYFEHHTTLNNQLSFIKNPLELDLFLNRKAYFLANNKKSLQDLLSKLIKPLKNYK